MLHKNLRGNSLHAPSSEVVENRTGITLPKLKVVAFDGIGDKFPKVKAADPNVYTTFGVVQKDIANGKAGYITCLGLMLDVDTSSWLEEALLYASSTGDLSTTPLGTPVALVVKSHNTEGVLYVFGIADIINTPDGKSWDITGNTGTDDTNFIGTRDAADFITKTNDSFRQIITRDGRFGYGVETPDEFIHIKAHAGYEGSGRRETSYALTTEDDSWNQAYSFVVPKNSVALINITAVGYTPPPGVLTRCSFSRTATVWREGSDAILANQQQSDYTFKDSDFNMRIRALNDSILVEVKGATSDLTKWSGYVNIDIVR